MKKQVKRLDHYMNRHIATVLILLTSINPELYAQIPAVTTTNDCRTIEISSENCPADRKPSASTSGQRRKTKKTKKKNKRNSPTERAPGDKKPPSNSPPPVMLDDVPQKPDDKF